MQETFDWTPPRGPLGRLVQKAAARVASGGASLRDLRAEAMELPAPASLAEALTGGQAVALIAEVKRRSPSKGELRPRLNAPAAAARYLAAGAKAISVLTEPSEFGGSLRDLVEVSRAVSAPTLRKDFHVDASQVWEARLAGAAAVLLIARALNPDRLRELFETALEAGLEALVEVRTERELELALVLGARLIGVNSRDLETLEIDVSVAERLLSQIPSGCAAIAESGIASESDVERVARSGADAVLVGSALSSSEDADSLVHRLTSVARSRRAS